MYHYAQDNNETYPDVYAGELAAVTTTLPDGSAGPWVSYTYDALGHIVSEKASNGVETDYAYDPKTWDIATITHKNQGGEIDELDYLYDGKQNVYQVKSISKVVPDEAYNNIKNYTYDAFNRLTDTLETDLNNNRVKLTHYDFDVLGNVLSVKTTDYTVNPANTTEVDYTYNTDKSSPHFSDYPYNALISIKSTDPSVPSGAFTYDQDGNMLTDNEGNIYTYNKRDQLVSFTDKYGTTTTYTYSADGIRESKTQGNTTIGFYYENLPSNGSDDTSNLPVLLNEVSNEQANIANNPQYLYSAYLLGAENERVARMLFSVPVNNPTAPAALLQNDNNPSFYLSNVRRDVTATTDANGNINKNAMYVYSDYGRVLSTTPDSLQKAKAGNAAAASSARPSTKAKQ